MNPQRTIRARRTYLHGYTIMAELRLTCGHTVTRTKEREPESMTIRCEKCGKNGCITN